MVRKSESSDLLIDIMKTTQTQQMVMLTEIKEYKKRKKYCRQSVMITEHVPIRPNNCTGQYFFGTEVTTLKCLYQYV